ncbi:glutamate receptor ionotropic kainate [Echinococcus multilocularis]|uniref:Glutamate receptor ionotropic kainate n=1 Tax=Echinococcus multilocularis TaxID=6211 RepID=A0A068YLC6_ECHMU|nr:glutamate receptor ionotropic kainate [Echinococcus multilocularis]
MRLLRINILLISAILALHSSAQLIAQSILFTDPLLDPKRCSIVFASILQRKEFANLSTFTIAPLFLNELKFPASVVDLENQLQIIKNVNIFVEIGPDYFYGPLFFPPEWKTGMNNVNRSRIVGFDLTFDVQNEVIKSAFNHLTSDIGVVKLAYFFDYAEGGIHPFIHIEIFQFLEQKVGQFLLYQLRDFASVEDALSKILVDGANVIVLNVGQRAALKLLEKAQEKNILQQPFYWLVFNAGVTLSGVELYVGNANFFAVEFSTNGRFTEFPELSAIPKPITPKDLIFRDTAVVGLQRLARLLSKTVPNDITLITSTRDGMENPVIQLKWKFYSYVDTNFDSRSAYEVTVLNNGSIMASFQALKQPPSRELLLNRMRSKPFRLGTIKVPPVITEETDKTGAVTVSGPEIVLAKALLNRLNVSYNITIFDLGAGKEVDGRWTGVFGLLEEWDIDLLVGPFSETWDRSKSFLSTSPIRSITYNYMYLRPSLKASLQIFQFVVAFDGYTWLLIFITAALFAGALTLLHKISPNTLSYTIHPSMLFVFGYLFQGVRTRPPSQASSQILIVVWWFFCLVLVIAFCANYAAYRSFTALETLPTTIFTLLHQEYYKYAYINGSNMESMMRVPLDPTIHALYTEINTKFKDMIPPNRSAGIDKVIKGGFALLDESPFIEYYARKYCLETSSALWYGAYVFYMPKLLPYYKIINDELTLMIADGTVDRIYKRGYEEQLAGVNRQCGATFKAKALEAMRNPLVNWSDYSVEFASAFGIFIVILIGLVIVLIVFIVEFCLDVYKKPEQGQ